MPTPGGCSGGAGVGPCGGWRGRRTGAACSWPGAATRRCTTSPPAPRAGCGSPRGGGRLAPREELLAAVPGPAGLALAVHDDGSGRTEVRLGGATLLAAPGRLSDLTWSPDGAWLLAAWPAAGRWLLVRVDGRPRVTAVSGFARRFGPGARPRGWCC